MSLNKAMLIGRLTADPELRNAGQSSVCNFTVATNESWQDKNGQKQERTEFHRCVAWGNLADIVARFCKKGRQVYVEGGIQTRQWQDKEGQTKYTTEIKTTTVQFLGDKGQSTGGSMGESHGSPVRGDMDNSDIPF